MKKVLLIISILFFTGCTAEYNLHFSEKTITESIKIIPETNQEQENVKSLESREIYAIIDKDEMHPYEVKQIEVNNYKTYEYTYNYSFNEFKRSTFTRCYDAYSILDENDVITFSTSKNFKCMVYDYMKIDNVVVNISTDYKVINHNADEVNGNVYTWRINDKNKDNKPIKFSYTKNAKRSLTFKEMFEKYKLVIIVAAAAILSVGFIVLLILIRHKRVNRI